jgi:DHA1 family inner membrane transport protein
MLARIVTSLCHGSFFGVGSVVAGKLVGEGRQAGAVAAVFSGLTIANIGGVPLAAWVGHQIGWRTAFAGIGGLGVIALAALQLALPRMPSEAKVDVRRELGVMVRPAVVLALLTTALGSAAMFTVFTYIAPILQQVTRVSPAVITVSLVTYGVGLTIGNTLGGRFADKALTPTLVVVLTALTALLLLFAVTMRWTVPAVATIFAWGVATFALVPPLQARIMSLAKAAPNLASSVNIGAFNLGNAAGAALGGGVIALNLGYPWVSVAGAAMALAALLLVLFSGRMNRA